MIYTNRKNKKRDLIISAFFSSIIISSQSVSAAPAPTFTTLYAHAQRFFKVQSFPYRQEITPHFIPLGNGKKMYFAPGSLTLICKPSGNDNLVYGNVTPLFSECDQRIRAARFAGYNSSGQPQPFAEWDGQNDSTGRDIWNFTYDGVFGHAVVDDRLFVVRHNEHQNIVETQGALGYQSHITPSRNHQVSGQRGGYWGANGCPGQQPSPEWADDNCEGGSYGAFVALGEIRINTTDGTIYSYKDYGPITWPSRGFYSTPPGSSQAPVRTNFGHSFPNLFYPSAAHDPDGSAFMYTFYVNSSDNSPQCISAARAWVPPANQETLPTSWHNFKNGSWDNSTSSTPADMRFSDMDQHYLVQDQGPSRPRQASCITSDSGYQSVWFQTAKLMGTSGAFMNRFIAVEERVSNDGNTWQMGIRYSNGKSLTSWGPFTPIDTVTVNTKNAWGKGRYSYPTFYSIDGNSNTEVKYNDFAIIGLRPSDTNNPAPLYLYRLGLTNASVP